LDVPRQHFGQDIADATVAERDGFREAAVLFQALHRSTIEARQQFSCRLRNQYGRHRVLFGELQQGGDVSETEHIVHSNGVARAIAESYTATGVKENAMK